jgi:hypothetical protein
MRKQDTAFWQNVTAVCVVGVVLVLAFGGCKSNKHKPHSDDPGGQPGTEPGVPGSSFVQADGQRLTLDGQPWKFRVDTAWRLGENLAGNRGNVVAYFDGRKAQTFNTIMVGCDGLWFAKDVSKPDATLFARLDATFADAEARGMFLILCPQITAYDKNGKPYAAVPRGQSEQVGAYYGARYGGQRALAFWMIGGADDKGAVDGGS